MDVERSLADVSIHDLLEAYAIPGLGPITLRRLLRKFGSWTTAQQAGLTELREAGVKATAARAIHFAKSNGFPEEELARAKAQGVEILTIGSPNFPPALRAQDDLPLMIYVKGEILERDALAIGVVGSRRASLYGKMHAERLSFELAQAGFTVVSGLAHGIDAAAHEGALKAGGRTIAVLGNGLGSIYPPEHEKLAERIAANGALVSELPIEAPPTSANFPSRNRIIVGMSLGVLVVEAARASGALITARLAGEMGKEIFAVPGDIGRPQTRGTHQLLRDGARLVESVDDIINELGPLEKPVSVGQSDIPIPDPRALILNPIEKKIYDLLDSVPKDIDEITRASGLSAANAASTLMVLELRRLVAQLPGKQYVRAGSMVR